VTPDEAAALLSSLTYKPRWTITAYTVPTAVVLRAGSKGPDVYELLRSGRTVEIDVVLTEAIQNEELARMSREDVLARAFEVFRRRELHEVEEWLRLNGQPVFAPHPGRGKPGILGNGRSTPT
jgi:hypothetical protein